MCTTAEMIKSERDINIHPVTQIQQTNFAMTEIALHYGKVARQANSRPQLAPAHSSDGDQGDLYDVRVSL